MNKTLPNPELIAFSRTGYCIFVDTLCGGMTPVWRDEQGKWIVHKTEAEAMAEVMDLYKERFRQYLDGERGLEDVDVDEDIICKVTQLPDGSVVDEWGQVFSV
jgi:hypothetical protein